MNGYTHAYMSNSLLVKLILIAFAFYIFIYNVLFGFQNNPGIMSITAYCVLILSGYLLLVSMKNWYLFIIFASIFLFNYSICMATYLGAVPNPPGFSIYFYTSVGNDPKADLGLNILLFFLIITAIFMPVHTKQRENTEIFILEKNYNPVICIGISIVLLLILIFEFSRPEVGSARGNRGVGSPLYEYSICFFIIGYYFSGGKKLYKTLFTFLLMVCAFQVIYYGGRVIALQIAIVWFLINYSHRTSVLKVFPFAVVGFVLFKGIAMFRADFQLSFEALQSITKTLIDEKMTVDTAYAAYHSSIMFLKVEDIVNMKERLYYFQSFLLSMILGASKVNDSHLADAAINNGYYVTGGGLLPYHFHFYLGWFGVTLISSIMGLYIRLINGLKKGSAGASKCICVFLVSISFRWYLYDPSGLIRGAGLMLIAYYLSQFAHDLMIGACKEHKGSVSPKVAGN